jgi:hypothetical protein
MGTGFVVRTGDGDAYLMPHLFERYCEVATTVAVAKEVEQSEQAGQQKRIVLKRKAR